MRLIDRVATDAQYNLPSDFRVFANFIVQQLETETFFGRMCNQQSNASCVPYPEDRPTTITVPEIAIFHEYFFNLRT